MIDLRYPGLHLHFSVVRSQYFPVNVGKHQTKGHHFFSVSISLQYVPGSVIILDLDCSTGRVHEQGDQELQAEGKAQKILWYRVSFLPNLSYTFNV